MKGPLFKAQTILFLTYKVIFYYFHGQTGRLEKMVQFQ